MSICNYSVSSGLSLPSCSVGLQLVHVRVRSYMYILLLSALFLCASGRQLMPVAIPDHPHHLSGHFTWRFHHSWTGLDIWMPCRPLNPFSCSLRVTGNEGWGQRACSRLRKDLVIIVKGRVVGGQFRLVSPIVMKNVTTNSSRTCPFTMSFGFVRLLLHYTTTHYILQSRVECIAFTRFHANTAFTALFLLRGGSLWAEL